MISSLANGFSSGSYGGGQIAAFVFGFVFLLAGGRAIMKYRSSRAAATTV